MSINKTMFSADAFRGKTTNKCGESVVFSENVPENVINQLEQEIEKKSQERTKLTAKYKIEIQWGWHILTGRLRHGLIMFWESGAKLHGGGDARVYVCPGKHRGRNECEALIPCAAHGSTVAVCPSCGLAWEPEQLIGEISYVLPIEKWSFVVHRWFLRANMNADIRIKYRLGDIRTAAQKEQEKEHRGDLLNVVRKSDNNPCRIYTLDSLMRDANAGSDLYTRIDAFMRM